MTTKTTDQAPDHTVVAEDLNPFRIARQRSFQVGRMGRQVRGYLEVHLGHCFCVGRTIGNGSRRYRLRHGPGGADSVKSNPVTLTIQP